MSETQNTASTDRINSILEESRKRGLSEPEAGVDPLGRPALAWMTGSTEIRIIATPALYSTVTAGETMEVDFNVAAETDSEVIDRVEREISKAAA